MLGIICGQRRNVRGVSMVEYAILLALICLISFGIVAMLGSNVKASFEIANCIGPGQGSGNGNGGGNGGGIGGGTGGGTCRGN